MILKYINASMGRRYHCFLAVLPGANHLIFLSADWSCGAAGAEIHGFLGTKPVPSHTALAFEGPDSL